MERAVGALHRHLTHNSYSVWKGIHDDEEASDFAVCSCQSCRVFWGLGSSGHISAGRRLPQSFRSSAPRVPTASPTGSAKVDKHVQDGAPQTSQRKFPRRKWRKSRGSRRAQQLADRRERSRCRVAASVRSPAAIPRRPLARAARSPSVLVPALRPSCIRPSRSPDTPTCGPS